MDFGGITNYILPAILVSLLYITIAALYDIYFHPLRNFPGPRLAEVSKLWSRYGNLKGRKSHRIHEAHRKYGM